MTEGGVYVYTIDETRGLGADPGDTNTNILALAITPNGPRKVTRVSGPTSFKRLYNSSQSITPSSDTTMQYVRALLNFAPIYVKR